MVAFNIMNDKRLLWDEVVSKCRCWHCNRTGAARWRPDSIGPGITS